MLSDQPAQRVLRFARTSRVARWLGLARDWLGFAELSLGPALDLAVRLWLAQIFWLSGLVKIADWNTAIALTTYEYPVAWLDPVSAAYLGAAVELIGPVLLVLGLATRFAALALLALSLVIQFEYQALNQHLFWALLFGWYLVMGAGPLSLDRLLSRGLAFTALPCAAPLLRGFAAVTRNAGAYYQLFIRAALAAVWLGGITVGPQTLAGLGYHLQSAAPGSEYTLLVCAVLLLLGLATRLAALAALLALSATAMLADSTAVQRIDVFYQSVLLAFPLVYGPGALSLDRGIQGYLDRRFPTLQGLPAAALEALPQVVIVGAGFGGLAAARALRAAPCRVTLVDRHNYHLFQPLLYQVATAGLSPADIAVPVRELLREQFNARVLLGEVSAVDTAAQTVVLGERRLAYDYLILATGARHAYFGRDEWEGPAPGLKQIDDATHIRRRLLLAFERAETSEDPQEQQRLLSFVIVGAGPTGVELAGAIAELARHGLAREFRQIDPGRTRVVLIQSGPRVLPTFPQRLSDAAAAALRELGVEVLTGSRVEQVDGAGVVVSGRRIEARTVFWAAGVVASPAAAWLGAGCDPAGRIDVQADLSVPGLANVFAIGDTASSTAWDGRPVPGLAPAAKQGGQYVASVIRARLQGRAPPPPFRYRHLGSLATIGRQAAVADFGRLRFSGALAWWLWGAVHILFLAGMRSRVLVAVQWFWAYLTFRRSTRLITGDGAAPLAHPLDVPDSTGAGERPALRRLAGAGGRG